MKYHTSFVVTAGFIALWISCSSAVYGEPIYSQVMPSEPIGAFSSTAGPISQKIADNFTFSGPVPITVRSLRVIGGSGPVDPSSDRFRVVFFQDAGGIPGAILTGGDFNIGPAFSRTPTGGPLLNGVTIPQEYILNLPDGVSLDPDTPYWVSVTNDLLPVSGWAWARADGVLDLKIASTQGDPVTGPWVEGASSGGMWFELSDQTIPEPTSLGLLLLAFASTVFFR